MMHGTQRCKQYSAAGSLGSGEHVQRYVLTPTSGVSTAVIKDGGSGGTTVLTITAAADGASVEIEPIAITAPYLSAITAGALLHVIE